MRWSVRGAATRSGPGTARLGGAEVGPDSSALAGALASIATRHPAVVLESIANLTGEDAAKAERFTESLRAARLDEALARDHIKFLREVALKDEDTARLWWLHCNLTGETPDTSWTAFTEIVRPLIRIADENDPVTRLARALLTMNDYFREDPDRLENLANLTAFAAAKVGEDEIARTLATLHQTARAGQSGTNGVVPAGSRGTDRQT
jgi:hypothetical protein